MKRVLALAMTLALGVACNAGGEPAPSPSVSPLSVPALKLRVLGAVGHPDYCDPDFYPRPYGTPLKNARKHIEEIQREAQTYAAILNYEHISAGQPLTDDELVRVYEDYKLIAHPDPIPLVAADGGYRFTVIVPNQGSGYDDQVHGA